MAQIDPIYFVTPLVVLAFSFGVVLVWRWRRQFTAATLGVALLAYGGAIIAKVLVQAATLGAVESASGSNPFVLGVYYGSQTAVLEVGGAFFVAALVVRHGLLTERDAGAYGLALGFWEDVAVVALPLLLEYTLYYEILASPGSAAAAGLSSQLMRNAPALFYGPSRAAPLVGFAILERASSMIAHGAWGYLAVRAVVDRRRQYLAVAAPIGFLAAFLVPFAGNLGLGPFEGVELAIACAGLVAALLVTRDRSLRPRSPAGTAVPPPWVPAQGADVSPRLNTSITAMANAAAPAATASAANHVTTGKTIVTPRSSGAIGPAIAAPAPATAYGNRR
jgi:hypothetical protein